MTGKVHMPVRLSVRPVYKRNAGQRGGPKFVITGWEATCPAHSIQRMAASDDRELPPPAPYVVAKRVQFHTTMNAALQHIERWHS